MQNIGKVSEMKKLLFIISAFIFIWACSTQKATVKVEPEQEKEIQEVDSIEYSMETFDSRFETWYKIHNKPALYRTQDYYEYWNKQYVLAWNTNARSGQHGSFFEPIVGYDERTDYGLELNHQLFYYFQYVENILKIKILPGWSPKAVPF